MDKREVFGAYLREKAKEHGWTQQEGADACGAHWSLYRKWLLGEVLPGPKSCAKIADALGVHEDEILGRG